MATRQGSYQCILQLRWYMMPLMKDARHKVEQALRNRDPQAFQLAMLDFPSFVDVDAEAMKILLGLPADVQDWWLKDECDLPEDGSDVLGLAFEMLRRRVADDESHFNRGYN